MTKSVNAANAITTMKATVFHRPNSHWFELSESREAHYTSVIATKACALKVVIKNVSASRGYLEGNL